MSSNIHMDEIVEIPCNIQPQLSRAYKVNCMICHDKCYVYNMSENCEICEICKDKNSS